MAQYPPLPPVPHPFKRGEVWRFRDGREGVCSSANGSSATFYVGPQAFTVPVGDWVHVLAGAERVPPTVVAPPEPAPPTAPPATLPAPVTELPLPPSPSPASPVVHEPPAAVVADEPRVALVDVPTPSTPRDPRSRGRRDRQRDPKV